MRLSIDAFLDYGFAERADVLLQIEAAALPDQRLEQQSLVIESDNPIRAVSGEEGIGQRTWATAEHRLVAHYRAVVAIDRATPPLGTLPHTPAGLLPPQTIPYLLPSRYCESHRFDHFLRRTFGGLRGGGLAVALTDWVRSNLDYDGAGSDGRSSALDTFAERRGVCRDYAHLLVEIGRASCRERVCLGV